MSLLPVAEAQARLLALADPLPGESVSLAAAPGRYLAEPLLAARTQPAGDLSAMDGYALAGAGGDAGWRVVGESAAGRPFNGALAAGEAVRIFTGALLPEGADRVLIQEEAQRDGQHVRTDQPAPVGSNIRRRGSDFVAGATLLSAGSAIGPATIALAAMAGHAALPVRRRVRVAIVSTGDELVEPGAPLPPGAIADSNRPMLAAMLGPLPVDSVVSAHAPDRLEALAALLAEAGTAADVVVTIGGASVGDHDLVVPALRANGIAPDFWRVAMRPGKPLLAARGDHALYLGLPGNPASAFVTATLFLLPLIRRLAGAAQPLPPCMTLPLTAPLPSGGARTEYWRARITADGVTPHLVRDSALLAVLAMSDALIVRPPDAPAADAGASVEVIALPQYLA